MAEPDETRSNAQAGGPTPAAARRKATVRDDEEAPAKSARWRAALGCSGLRAASKLSFASIYRVGGAAGAGLMSIPSRERAATAINLEMCMPELDQRARVALARASLIETGRTMLELSALWCWPGERVLGLVREVRGLEHLERARAQGSGVILLTPHLGAWELCGLYFSSIAPLTAMYKPPPVREMESFYTDARSRLGAKLVPADAGGVRALHRALRNNEVIGILPDQDPGDGSGIFVPFFGVLANTTTLVAKLAAKSSAPLLLVWAERLPRAAGFRIHVVEPQRAIGIDDVEAGTRALNAELEALVRSAPQQYLWSYKRFRYRPAGLKNPYRHGVSEKTMGVRLRCEP